MSAWYLKGQDGRRFNWNKEPTFVCSIGKADRLGDLFETACEEADIDPKWLLRRLQHNAYRGRDETGKLTDRCAHCGHRMERLGFRCWVERDLTQKEMRDNLGAEMTQRLGFNPAKTERSFYVDTKAKAERWASREVELTRAAAT